MRTTVREILVLAALLPPAAAQGGHAEPQRRPTFTRVIDTAGEPVAGAVVTFAGCVPYLGTTIGPHDEQVVAADERGRARARLQEGLCYVAWATAEADGARRVSDVVGYFGAGALTELVCRDAGPARRVEVHGAEAWAEAGPLRLFAVTPTPGTETPLVLVDGAVQVPILPEWRLDVRTADGSPLWLCQSPGDRVEIPPPQRLLVRVVDEHGAPVPGARLEQRVGREARWKVDVLDLDFLATRPDEIRRGLGVVGADGTAELTICSSGDLLRDPAVRDVLLFASAAGLAPATGGRFLDGFYVDGRRVRTPPASVLQFTLPRVEPLTGWVGAVPAGTVAHLLATCRLYSAANNYFHDARSFVAPVTADGRVVFTDVPAEIESCRLSLVSPRDDAVYHPLLPARAGRSLPFDVPSAAAANTRLPACDLTLQVMDSLGGPANGLVVGIVPQVEEGLRTRDLAFLVPLDAGGRACTRIAAGKWSLLTVTDRGWVAAAFECEPGAQMENIVLASMHHMQVRLRDTAGGPVAGATVVVAGGGGKAGEDDREHAVLQVLSQGAIRSQWPRLRTDADGRIVVPFVPVAGASVRLRFSLGDRHTDKIELKVNDAPLELRLP